MRFCIVFLMTVLLSACAATPADNALTVENNDPFEPFNRTVFSVNMTFDEYLFRPVVNGYRFVVPQPAREGVSNFFDNLNTPLTLSNNVLQGRLKRAGITAARLIINTVAGFFGTYDVAAKIGLEKEKSGFGDTLGVWGVPSGPYLVLPLFGPSDIRSAAGLGADVFLNPMTYAASNNHKRETDWFFRTETAVGAFVSYNNAIDLLDDLKKNSLDFYAATRSMYQQYRDARINRLKGISEETADGDDVYEFSLDDE